MANSDDLQGGDLADSYGNQSTELQSSGPSYVSIGNTCSRAGKSRNCRCEVYPYLEVDEPEKCNTAEGDNSKLEQRTRDLFKAGAEVKESEKLGAEAKEWEKFNVLRQVFSECRKDWRLLDLLLMKEAHELFPTAFPKEYCTEFSREVKIQMFQRTKRERFCSHGQTSHEAVVKEFIPWIRKYWSPAQGEVLWRMKGFIFSGETLGHLQSVARKFDPTEEQKGKFKLRWRETMPKDYYYLCKAAAVGDEKFHCNIFSPELNVIGRADSKEYMFQGEDLNDFVKDITKLGQDGAAGDDDRHKQPDGAQDDHV